MEILNERVESDAGKIPREKGPLRGDQGTGRHAPQTTLARLRLEWSDCAGAATRRKTQTQVSGRAKQRPPSSNKAALSIHKKIDGFAWMGEQAFAILLLRGKQMFAQPFEFNRPSEEFRGAQLVQNLWSDGAVLTTGYTERVYQTPQPCKCGLEDYRQHT